MNGVFALVALLLQSGANASAPGPAPVVDVPVQETCREHIINEPRLAIEDWPREFRGREFKAYVTISYDLNGSGKAENLRLAGSEPSKAFDRATLNILKGTEFTPGVQAKDCMYVRTYAAVRRTER
jgi:TonB family protein